MNQSNKKRAASVAAQKKTAKKNGKAKKVILKIIKWFVILGILIGLLIFFITSPVFNIKEVVVEGNEKIAGEEIIYLSEVQVGDNIYHYSKRNPNQNQ